MDLIESVSTYPNPSNLLISSCTKLIGVGRAGGFKNCSPYGQTRSNFFIYSFLPHIIKIDKKVLSYVQNWKGGEVKFVQDWVDFLSSVKIKLTNI